MISRRRLRPLAHRLADLMEAGAERLRKAVERKPRPRPLRFPTEFELVMERHTAQMARKLLDDITFLGSGVWPTRVTPCDEAGPKFVPINKLKPYVIRTGPAEWKGN